MQKLSKDLFSVGDSGTGKEEKKQMWGIGKTEQWSNGGLLEVGVEG